MLATIEAHVLVPNGEKIRALREAKRWTLDDAFAEAHRRGLDLSRNTLRSLELGAKGCRLVTLSALLDLYGLSRRALLDLVREEPETPAPGRR